jgi:signal transduction histidine kinase
VIFFIPWCLGAYNPLRRAVVGLVAAESLGVWVQAHFTPSFGDFFFVSLLIGVSWMSGVFVSRRSQHAHEMAGRAEQLERQQREAAERAVAEERQRIAASSTTSSPTRYR